ncbi:unnamed protein product [Trichobilharzia szidati]|nr:unnamed protein product [Trichobilharzia szidati]
MCQRVSLCHGYQGIYLNCPNGAHCDENQEKYMCKQSVSSNAENKTEERINSTVYNTSCSVGYHRMYSNQSLDTLNEIPSDQFKQLIYSTDNRENKLLCYCQSGQLECIQHPDYSLLLLIQSVPTNPLYINQSIHQRHLHENQLCRICSKLQKSSQKELSSNLSKWYADYCILCSFMDNMTEISNFTYWWVIEQNPSPPSTRWENHSLCKICVQLNNTQYCQPLICSSFMAFTSIEYYQLCCSTTVPHKKKQFDSPEETTSLSHLSKCTNSRLASSLKSMPTLQCIDCQCVSGQLECVQHPDYSLLLLIQSISTNALYINQSAHHHHHLYDNQLCRICSKLHKSSQRELSLNLSKWYADYCILCSFMDNMTEISNFTYWWAIEQNPPPPPLARWKNHSLCKICIELNNTEYCQPLLCSSFMAFTSIEYYQLCCSNTIPLEKKQLNSPEQTTSLSHLNKCTNSRLASSLKSMSTAQCIDCQCVNDRIYCTLNATQIYQRNNVTVQCDQLLSTLQRDSLLIPMKYNRIDKSGDGQ